MGGEISICDTRGSRQNKSRSGHEATINRALPPAIRLCAICRNARRTRKLRSGIHGVRFASFRASLRGGSRSMKETRQAPRSASRLAICSVFRVSHEYSAFNGRVALVTLKSRAARFRQAACRPSKRYKRLGRLFQTPLREQGDTSKEARETRRRIARRSCASPGLASFSSLLSAIADEMERAFSRLATPNALINTRASREE